MGDRPFFLLYVLVGLEIGIFLVLVPWSAIWERNYFLEAMPMLRPYVTSPWFRGAVTGLGIANIYMALREVVLRRGRARSFLDETVELQEASPTTSAASEPREAGPRESWVASED